MTDFSARRRLWKLVPILEAQMHRQQPLSAGGQPRAAAECKSAAFQARSGWSAGTAREARWPARSDDRFWDVGLGFQASTSS